MRRGGAGAVRAEVARATDHNWIESTRHTLPASPLPQGRSYVATLKPLGRFVMVFD